MNRQKKIREKFNKKVKKAKAKRFPKNKEPYISKADRLKMEQEQSEEQQSDAQAVVANEKQD